MYCNGFLVVTIFFIYFLKSFYTYVEFQGVSSLTPGRVSSPEHPGPSLEPLSDIFCESAVSRQLSQCCAQLSAHVPFSSSSIGLFGCRHQCSSQRQLWGARARLLPCWSWIPHICCMLQTSPSASGAAPIPASHLTVGTLGLQCRCGSAHPACYRSFSEPARRQAWEAERSNSLSHLPSPDVFGFYSYCKHFYNI